MAPEDILRRPERTPWPFSLLASNPTACLCSRATPLGEDGSAPSGNDTIPMLDELAVDDACPFDGSRQLGVVALFPSDSGGAGLDGGQEPLLGIGATSEGADDEQIKAPSPDRLQSGRGSPSACRQMPVAAIHLVLYRPRGAGRIARGPRLRNRGRPRPESRSPRAGGCSEERSPRRRPARAGGGERRFPVRSNACGNRDVISTAAPERPARAAPTATRARAVAAARKACCG